MKVWIIQHKESMMFHGCFDSEQKAKNYINGSKDFYIFKTDVV